jgi:hypothetical protein
MILIMTEEDRIKSEIYKEFYGMKENQELFKSKRSEDRIEYFRKLRMYYEGRIYGQIEKPLEENDNF